MFLFYNYNFTLDFSGKTIYLQRIELIQVLYAKILTFLTFEAS